MPAGNGRSRGHLPNQGPVSRENAEVPPHQAPAPDRCQAPSTRSGRGKGAPPSRTMDSREQMSTRAGQAPHYGEKEPGTTFPVPDYPQPNRDRTRGGYAKTDLSVSERRNCRTRARCCLLYTSDAADDLLCVDLGGRRIIKKKKT